MASTSTDVPTGDSTFTSERAAKIYAEARNWRPEQKAAVLKYLESADARAKIRARYRNVAELASAVDPDFVVTPAIDLIANAIETVLAAPRRNLMVSMPPQEGKSTTCAVWTPIRAWQLNPNRRIILASYGDDLAHTHSQNCRNVILAHGGGVVDPLTGAEVEDKLGLKISAKTRRIDAWQIDGGKGGLVAVGLGSAVTGRAADLLIIDDPYKNMQEADSATHRRKVDEWMSSVALTRLSPEASIILIQTRWHPEDLSGKTLAAERSFPRDLRTWRYINIPAIAEEGIPDSLGRAPGEVMVSARGRTREEFEATRRNVGERTWYALYQGSPRNPEGGLFERKWFEPRVDTLPEHPVAAVVAVDPADSGEGDETGIIGGVLAGVGTTILTEDWSGLHTSDQWGKKAVELALTIGAREIVLEGYSTYKTYESVLKRAWVDMNKTARERLAAGENLSRVELQALVPTMPFVIVKYTEAGDPVGRAAALRQAFEIKTARTVEYKLGVFEDQAADWQVGQHCPDRVAAAVMAHWRLAKLGSSMTEFASPLHGKGPGSVPDWLTRSLRGTPSGLPFGRRT
ncbi:terminase large subunit domain-containing protein [Mycobacteroides abscessus]|uniref:terminase large subunit domain-containing protein n=1 Tax=Mycobacteroides abscessus TaxID=36809 RepID=UPI0002DC6F87|nr:terminase family protein [Mycobacteroides abscessus]